MVQKPWEDVLKLLSPESITLGNQKSILEEISDDEDTNFDDTDSDSEDSLDHGIHGFFFVDEESMSSEDDLESEIPL